MLSSSIVNCHLFEKNIGSYKKGQNTERKNKGMAPIPQRSTIYSQGQNLNFLGHVKRIDKDRMVDTPKTYLKVLSKVTN